MFTLKKGAESFQVVDGPLAGKRYVRGKAYKQVPPEERAKFEEIKPPEAKDKKAAPSGAKAQAPDKESSKGGDKP